MIYIINDYFLEWNKDILKLSDTENIKILSTKQDILDILDNINNKIINVDDLILPLSYNSYQLFNNCKNTVFHNNLDNIDIFENKSKFAEYMNNKFKNHIPETVYYSYDDKIYNFTLEYKYKYNLSKNETYIYKPALSFGGIGIKLLNYKPDTIISYCVKSPHLLHLIKKPIRNNLNPQIDTERLLKNFNVDYGKNCLIQKYIEHTEYYSGHFLVLNGKIIKKIYFKANNNDKHLIKKGAITDYEILDKLDCDDTCFDLIMLDLNISLFICVDFTIIDKNIIIFEINCRLGGSLVRNNEMFKMFFNELMSNIKK